jgi:hypothetical protein
VYKMLQKAGNKNTKMVNYKGGHVYLNTEVEKMYNWMRQFKKE